MYTRCRFTASLIHRYLGDSSSLKVIKPDHQKEFFWTGFGLCCATWLRIFIFLETVLFDTAYRHESISCLPGALTPRVLKSQPLNSKIVIAYNSLRGEADFILPDAGRLYTGVGGFPCPHPQHHWRNGLWTRGEREQREADCLWQLQAGCKVTPVSKGATGLNSSWKLRCAENTDVLETQAFWYLEL